MKKDPQQERQEGDTCQKGRGKEENCGFRSQKKTGFQRGFKYQMLFCHPVGLQFPQELWLSSLRGAEGAEIRVQRENEWEGYTSIELPRIQMGQAGEIRHDMMGKKG